VSDTVVTSDLLDVFDVAAGLKVSPESVHRLCRAGQLRAVRLSGQWRIDVREVARRGVCESSTDPRRARTRTVAGY
jgi:hypothetical protein